MAFLSLDEIHPRPVLGAASRPATSPSDRPPVDALVLFAKARESMLANQRFTAINLLEQAVALDPGSYELHAQLGRAYLDGSTHDDRSIAAMARAASIEPDHLDLQVDLGRQYLAKGDVDRAVRHFRLALQTSDYQTDEAQAGLADLFLARALQQKGYDRAALQQYDRLLRRVKDNPLALRTDPRLGYLVSDRLHLDIGDLYAKHGQYEEALQAYVPAAERDPTDFSLQSKVVRTMLSAGRQEDAERRAADVVVTFHASPDSLPLLREAYRGHGGDAAAIDQMRRLRQQRPKDRAILFALADLLRTSGRADEAESLLADAASAAPDDPDLFRRRFELRLAASGAPEAARFVIESVARQSDFVSYVGPLWSQLIRPGLPGRLRAADLQNLRVRPESETARLFFLSRLAESTGRRSLASDSLEAAAARRPAFEPAFRDLLARARSRTGVEPAAVARRAEELAVDAARAGNPALAAEVRGLQALNARQGDLAVKELDEAARLGGRSPDVALARAVANRLAGQEAKFEQLLWKLISDYPAYEDGYVALYAYYTALAQRPQIEKVLMQWLASIPDSVEARVQQARLYFGAGRADAAEVILSRLFQEHPGDPQVLSALQSFYTQTGKADELIAKLEEHRAAQPRDLVPVARLVDVYAEQKRLSDASRVLDAVRSAGADDADLLYDLSHLYTRIGQIDTAEAVLQEVLRLDPSHGPAGNDLGYSWGEQGKNLDRAEALTRQAAHSDPRNPSFLDSLGWVLYKRGKFDEARQFLEQAVTQGEADPVVLDHFGDVLYRAGDAEAAAKQWRAASEKLKETEEDADRPDLKKLRLQLNQKTRQLDARQPVDVAPVADGVAPSAAAGR